MSKGRRPVADGTPAWDDRNMASIPRRYVGTPPAGDCPTPSFPPVSHRTTQQQVAQEHSIRAIAARSHAVRETSRIRPGRAPDTPCSPFPGMKEAPAGRAIPGLQPTGQAAAQRANIQSCARESFPFQRRTSVPFLFPPPATSTTRSGSIALCRTIAPPCLTATHFWARVPLP